MNAQQWNILQEVYAAAVTVGISWQTGHTCWQNLKILAYKLILEKEKKKKIHSQDVLFTFHLNLWHLLNKLYFIKKIWFIGFLKVWNLNKMKIYVLKYTGVQIQGFCAS